jgi:hypothetical protein
MMIPLVLAAALSANAATGCKPSLERGERVIERRVLKVRDGTLEAVAVAQPDAKHMWPGSRMMVLGSDCKAIFSQRFQDAARVMFTKERLGDQPLLFVTAFKAGGSGCGYDHALLLYGGQMFAEDGVQPLAPMLLTHSNMDGIFVGDLGRTRGPGLVMWSAQWKGLESHYEPHQYELVTYRWRNGRFVGPSARTSKRKYDPGDVNAVARHLGLMFNDMTRKERFWGC